MMDTEILMAASAITDFINRCTDMKEAKIVSADKGITLEKTSANPFLTVYGAINDLSIITALFSKQHAHEFVFALFKEMKARYSEQGFLIYMGTGCCLGNSEFDDGSSHIMIALKNV